jgi:hypothetical protein
MLYKLAVEENYLSEHFFNIDLWKCTYSENAWLRQSIHQEVGSMPGLKILRTDNILLDNSITVSLCDLAQWGPQDLQAY